MPTIDELLEEALVLQGKASPKEASPEEYREVFGWFIGPDEYHEGLTVRDRKGNVYPHIRLPHNTHHLPVVVWKGPPEAQHKFAFVVNGRIAEHGVGWTLELAPSRWSPEEREQIENL